MLPLLPSVDIEHFDLAGLYPKHVSPFFFSSGYSIRGGQGDYAVLIFLLVLHIISVYKDISNIEEEEQ